MAGKKKYFEDIAAIVESNLQQAALISELLPLFVKLRQGLILDLDKQSQS